MKKIILISIILLFVPYNALAGKFFADSYGEDWNKLDTCLLTSYNILVAIDWMQTKEIAKHPERWKELNPAFHTHPSIGEVNTKIGLTTAAINLIYPAFNPKFRRFFIGGTITCEVLAVAHNYSMEIRIKF